jgi:hypothetical protein
MLNSYCTNLNAHCLAKVLNEMSHVERLAVCYQNWAPKLSPVEHSFGTVCETLDSVGCHVSELCDKLCLEAM